MLTETVRPEIIEGALSFVLLAAPLLGVLSLKQRQAILERDGNRCRVPVPHECNGYEVKPNGERNLQVDHVIPQRWGQRQLGMTEEELDQPENLVTECENFHQHVRHPDMQEQRLAWKMSRHDRRVFDRRDQLADEGKPYWFTVYDSTLKNIALEMTRKMDALKGGRTWYPGKNHKNGNGNGKVSNGNGKH